MEILRNLLGNLGAGLIRLLVAVGILAAVGYFIVRPVLDKTGEIGRETNRTLHRSLNRGFGKNGAGIEDVDRTLREVDRRVRREIERSFRAVESHGVVKPRKLVRCIQHAQGNAHKIQRCTVKF